MVTRPALEQNEHGREEFKTVIKTHFHPEQLVFADESHFNQLTLRRPYAWFIRGERACRYEFFSSWYKVFEFAHAVPRWYFTPRGPSLENAITGEDFLQFVRGSLPHLNECPLPRSVLVIDNASIHKVAGIREMVEGRGASSCLYLPAYSPDLNPIELAFAAIKTWLRTNRDCQPGA